MMCFIDEVVCYWTQQLTALQQQTAEGSSKQTKKLNTVNLASKDF